MICETIVESRHRVRKDLYKIRRCEDVILFEEYPEKSLEEHRRGKYGRYLGVKRRGGAGPSFSYMTWTIKRFIEILRGVEERKTKRLSIAKAVLDRSFLAYDLKTGEVATGLVKIFLGYNILIIVGREDSELVKKIIRIYEPSIVISFKDFDADCFAKYERKGFIVCKRHPTIRDLRIIIKTSVLKKFGSSV